MCHVALVLRKDSVSTFRCNEVDGKALCELTPNQLEVGLYMTNMLALSVPRAHPKAEGDVRGTRRRKEQADAEHL